MYKGKQMLGDIFLKDGAREIDHGKKLALHWSNKV